MGRLDIKCETWDSNVLSYITSTTMSLANWGEKKATGRLASLHFFLDSMNMQIGHTLSSPGMLAFHDLYLHTETLQAFLFVMQ